MVRKILTDDYLKKFGDMSAEERDAYGKRVGEWLCTDGARLLTMTDRPMAKTQNVLAMSVRWSADDSRAFQDGVRLLTALVDVTETWLPMLLYRKSVWRAVRKMTEELSQVKHEEPRANEKPGSVTADNNDEVIRVNRPNEAHKTKKTIAPLSVEMTGEPVRPKHIDQYVHLLPENTQKRAVQVRELLRDLDAAREKARLLMDAGEQGDKVAQWAKKATLLDDKVRSIYRELDSEWEKLVQTGRVVVDIFGNAIVVEDIQSNLNNMNTREELTTEQKARRRDLRKWLIDLRRGNRGKAREKRIEQWKANWKEYMTLEPIEDALKDEKIVAAAEHFGIEINS